MSSNTNELTGYNLSQAINYMRKAKKILCSINILNSKVENDFHGIESFCANVIKNLKESENDMEVHRKRWNACE